jgi:hypothetical protein
MVFLQVILFPKTLALCLQRSTKHPAHPAYMVRARDVPVPG